MRHAILMVLMLAGCAEEEDPCSECRKEKKKILWQCQSPCEAKNYEGEEFDACLNRCSREHFTKDVPSCTPICKGGQ